MSAEKVKVLYIAGVGRSGSTLLGRLMGEPSQAVHVGEMDYVWQRFFREQHLCGCGRPFRECEFWEAVFAEGFGGFDQVDFEAILKIKRASERVRTLPRLLSPWKTAEQQKKLDEYAQVLNTLYCAIQKVSGARLIVDGSKSVPYSYLLPYAPDLDMRAVHLVRDSRAVAFSHQRRKPNPSLQSAEGYLATVNPLRVALVWNVTNGLLSLKKPSHPSFFLRYEDMVRAPRATLTRLWELMEEPVPSLEFLGNGQMSLRTNHTVAGNPDRFRADVTLRLDTIWQQKMPWRQRALMTALTLPLLAGYGYLGRPLTVADNLAAPLQKDAPLA